TLRPDPASTTYAPAGPVAPASPEGPGSPAGPCGPSAPAGPCGPCAPAGPSCPSRPAGPWVPEQARVNSARATRTRGTVRWMRMVVISRCLSRFRGDCGFAARREDAQDCGDDEERRNISDEVRSVHWVGDRLS